MKRVVPLVLVAVLFAAGCEHLIMRAVEQTFTATESWVGKIAVLVVAFLLVVLVKWASEGGRRRDEDGDSDRDRRRR